MRRLLALLLALAWIPCVPTVGAQDAPSPSGAGAGFWTDDELRLIDRGLEVLDCDRKDLGFQKRPIDDPFRLSVVNRVLDAPLSIGDEAQGWDDVARRGDPAELLDRAAKALDLALPAPSAAPAPSTGLDAPGLPPAVLAPLRVLLGAVATARDAVAASRASLGPDADAVLRKALRTQVEKPQDESPGEDMTDEAFLAQVRQADRAGLVAAAAAVLRAIPPLVTALRDAKPGSLGVPKEGLRLDAPGGAVRVTGTGDDVHDEGDDVAVVVDLGGDDTWKRGASAGGARPVSVCLDLAGDDRYVGRHDLSFGAALGGVAIQWDGGGNDLYDAGHASLGAGVLGVGVLVDEGGDDVYRCRDFGEGAGAFGVGLLVDRDGNDLRHADLFGQGFASTWGCGVLVDLAGNDVYDAGGVHGDAPLHRDRTQSLSQGFSIGMRPDASGGVGVLVDVAGNDRYGADIYGQGASYWFSLGLLVDDEGNDTYVLGHYGQGSGIHLSAGMLLDRRGQDLYYTEYGVGIGGAHDFAVGFLVDREGDDHYDGSGGAQGGALTNSVAMLIDDAGDDGYTAVRIGGSQGSATPARDTGGIALLLDGGGKDVYSEVERDGRVWTKDAVGAGLDEPTAPEKPAPADPMGARITEAQAKAAVDEEGTVPAPGGGRADDLDRLWKIACRWQVGDERVIGPIARRRLVALGDAALDRAIDRLGSKDGLELECVAAMLEAFPRERVAPRLLKASRSEDVAVRRAATRFLGSLAVAEAEPRLVELLADAEIRPIVLRALAALKKAPPSVAGFLRSPKEAEGVAATLCLAAVADAAAIDALVGAMAPDVAFPVRLAAEQRLAALGEKAVPALERAAREAPTVRQRRSALRALGGTATAKAVPPVLRALPDPDPWIRLSARLAAQGLVASLPPEATADLREALAARAEAETDPLVRRLREPTLPPSARAGPVAR